MGNNPVAEAMEEMHQTLSEEVLEKLREIFAWLEKDAQDQFKDLDHFEEMLESISHSHTHPSLLISSSVSRGENPKVMDKGKQPQEGSPPKKHMIRR
jgi:hypothetical protein